MQDPFSRLFRKIRDYYAKRSTFNLILDIFFYVFLVLLLIPATRAEMATVGNKLLTRTPGAKRDAKMVRLTDSDYRWGYQDLEGNQQSFASLKGEVIFLNYWATWCPPCIAEMPNIQALYDKMGDRVRFVLLSSESPEVIREFMKKNDYRLPVYRSFGNPRPIFHSRAIPTTYVIAPDGRIVVKKTGSARWDSERFVALLESLLE